MSQAKQNINTIRALALAAAFTAASTLAYLAVAAPQAVRVELPTRNGEVLKAKAIRIHSHSTSQEFTNEQ